MTKQQIHKIIVTLATAIVTCAAIALGLTSCNVTRTITTQSQYYQRGDTTCTIVTKTIEQYHRAVRRLEETLAFHYFTHLLFTFNPSTRAGGETWLAQDGINESRPGWYRDHQRRPEETQETRRSQPRQLRGSHAPQGCKYQPQLSASVREGPGRV